MKCKVLCIYLSWSCYIRMEMGGGGLVGGEGSWLEGGGVYTRRLFTPC